MYQLYRSRHAISWLPLPVFATCLFFASQQPPLKVQQQYDETAMALTLAEPEPIPQPEPIPEPEPEPVPQPEPEPEPTPVNDPDPIIEAPPVTPPKPEVKPKPKPEVKPKAETKPKPTPTPAKPTAPRPEAPAKRPTPAAPSAPSVNVAALENSYAQALRAQLEQTKRYPTGRQASLERPEGRVEVWLEVDRTGRVIDSGISSKARSMLLNRAAQASLQSIKQVRAFPADAFAGQNTKRFLATFDYQAQ
ncbi:energy transducer TonB [Pectobacterium brasiliense]|uniref:energy transducer TonB n=1 Tax=Pectobacterium brasiliense TaxID=180957 RepID=UPI00057C62EF|nr:energy transducer TonB [Pectobacterium brasiliense]KHT42860.1 energy transducer TonB [Pectobacterium brasiliense]MBN3181327.1 energy transducer TonB [Pectobacterium brasiliense]PPE60845.1 biopolymer transporter TonB [Pectobacterium brasiliense]